MVLEGVQKYAPTKISRLTNQTAPQSGFHSANIKIENNLEGTVKGTAYASTQVVTVRLLPLPQPLLRARTDKSKRPESDLTKECDRARLRCLKTEPH
jgi:hypothetical protein